MSITVIRVRRVVAACLWAPRRLLSMYPKLMAALLIVCIIITTTTFRFPREEQMEMNLASMRARMQFLESMYRLRLEAILNLQAKAFRNNNSLPPLIPAKYTPELRSLIKRNNGSRACEGLQVGRERMSQTPFVYQLLPHLMSDQSSLRPAYHMRAGRSYVDVVVGIPTVRRDKETYLMTTLKHLIEGVKAKDLNSTLIVVFIGDTDLNYVVSTAVTIENLFTKHVRNGLIEVLSPSPSYYPDLEAITPSLGDSLKRTKWRTKQNLDTLYLMAYAQTKGTYYLMLEDDVIADPDYMRVIKQFTLETLSAHPNWFYINYCLVGGIGKLFRSADLPHFITYLQLFYANMPVDWLLESYLADRVCTINKGTKDCENRKNGIRPSYKKALFKHIGLYSSLRGKIQKVEDPRFAARPMFYSHKNPPLLKTASTLSLGSAQNTLERAYEGTTFFWGIKPKKGDLVEFWFLRPMFVKRYLFRSANARRKQNIFRNTVVEVLPIEAVNFTQVGEFDEFGLAEGEISGRLSPLAAVRLRVLKDNKNDVILSEIELKTPHKSVVR